MLEFRKYSIMEKTKIDITEKQYRNKIKNRYHQYHSFQLFQIVTGYRQPLIF